MRWLELAAVEIRYCLQKRGASPDRVGDARSLDVVMAALCSAGFETKSDDFRQRSCSRSSWAG